MKAILVAALLCLPGCGSTGQVRQCRPSLSRIYSIPFQARADGIEIDIKCKLWE